MVLTLNPGKMIIVFLKALMWIIIAAFVSSIVILPIVNTNENKQQGTRSIYIIDKIDNGYYLKFKVEDIETGNKFSITPTRTWYESMEVGDRTATTASLNDTRVILMAWLTISFIVDMFVLAILAIAFLVNLPGMIENLNKEVVIDLRSKKTKQRELTLKELEKTPEFKAWRKDYEKALHSI